MGGIKNREEKRKAAKVFRCDGPDQPQQPQHHRRPAQPCVCRAHVSGYHADIAPMRTSCTRRCTLLSSSTTLFVCDCHLRQLNRNIMAHSAPVPPPPCAAQQPPIPPQLWRWWGHQGPSSPRQTQPGAEVPPLRPSVQTGCTPEGPHRQAACRLVRARSCSARSYCQQQQQQTPTQCCTYHNSSSRGVFITTSISCCCLHCTDCLFFLLLHSSSRWRQQHQRGSSSSSRAYDGCGQPRRLLQREIPQAAAV